VLCFCGCSFEELKEELHGWPVAATWRKIVKLMVWRWLPPKGCIYIYIFKTLKLGIKLQLELLITKLA